MGDTKSHARNTALPQSLKDTDPSSVRVDVERRRRRLRVWTTITLLAVLYTLSGAPTIRRLLSSVLLLKSSSGGRTINTSFSPDFFNWTAIPPSKTLDWTSCYDVFECTRLAVPLHYADPGIGSAAIAIIRSPALIPRGEDGYKGPILFNPGGPGGSGVSVILSSAGPLRQVLGDGFDLVGFDPRGVGFTTPTLSPFTSQGESAMFLLRFTETLNHTASAFGEAYGNAQNYGHIAKDRLGDALRYVGTPALARDMMSMVKAYGEDKLQYWGFSYGTVLGATFAAMFPNNVGRIVLDGVVDSEDYYKGRWSTNLVDTDTSLMMLYQRCVDAGPLQCEMYQPTAKQLATRVENILTKLRTQPISVYNPITGQYGMVDYSLVKRTIFGALYFPLSLLPYIWTALAGVEKGDGELMWTISAHGVIQGLITESCVCPSPAIGDLTGGWEAMFGIACGDAEPTTRTFDELKRNFEELATQSSFGECWGVRVGCSGWKVPAIERFDASFETNTSFPIMFIGNTADPVTPLQNALKMSAGFGNSVVLTQQSGGHCSVAVPSYCTVGAVRDYFQHGILPKEGTKCLAESLESHLWDDLTAEQQSLLQASAELQRIYPVARPILPL